MFPKWQYPTTIGFPTKNDHFGVFWGYHHFRKHPNSGKWIANISSSTPGWISFVDSCRFCLELNTHTHTDTHTPGPTLHVSSLDIISNADIVFVGLWVFTDMICWWHIQMQQRFMILYFVAREVSSILPACAADSCFSSWIWTDVFLLQYHTNSNTGHGSIDLYAPQFCPVNTYKYLLYYCTIIQFSHSPTRLFTYLLPSTLGISNWRRYLVAHGPWDRIIFGNFHQLGLSDKDQESLIWKKNWGN